MNIKINSETSATPTFKDRKRLLWPMGFLVPLLPLVGWQAAEATGIGLFWWSVPVFIYFVLPIIDHLIGEDFENPHDSQVKQLEADRFYRWCTYLFLPAQYGMFIWGCWAFTVLDLKLYEQIGLIISIGGINGLGINAAHELGHKKPTIERWLSKIILAPVCYGHFYVEHNRGHHRNVATPEDPASSRLGESFFAFWPRTVIGSLRSAWRLEAERLQRRNETTISLQNHNIQALLITVALWGGLIITFGPALIIFLVIQAVYGFSLLEVVNYIEHYGLKRQKDESGKYVRVQPEHSWNSNHIATNIMLYHLQRHADHHANPTRRFQALRHFENAPQLPGGYATMIPLALIPPLWFRIMDKKVYDHYQGDLSLANTQTLATI